MRTESDPALAPRLKAAARLALGGDWRAAHAIVQEYEEDPIAAWIHAVVHRMEGDLGNARYWYRRCRRELDESVSTEAELRQIRTALTPEDRA